MQEEQNTCIVIVHVETHGPHPSSMHVVAHPCHSQEAPGRVSQALLGPAPPGGAKSREHLGTTLGAMSGTCSESGSLT